MCQGDGLVEASEGCCSCVHLCPIRPRKKPTTQKTSRYLRRAQQRLAVSDVSVSGMGMLRRLRRATVCAAVWFADGLPARGLQQFRSARAARPATSNPSWSARVTFRNLEIIAEIYAQALQANGFDVGRRMGIGSRETYIPALKDHSIDLVPEYIGNLLLYFEPDSDCNHARRRRVGALQEAAG